MSEKAVAFLWKNSETGQTRVVLADQVITVDGSWEVVGPLVLDTRPAAFASAADERKACAKQLEDFADKVAPAGRFNSSLDERVAYVLRQQAREMRGPT